MAFDGARNRGRKGISAALGLVLASCLQPGGAALAQGSERERLERVLGEVRDPLQSGPGPNAPLTESLYTDFGLSFREAYLNVDNEGDTTSRLWQTRGRVYTHLSLAGAHEAYLRLNFDYRAYGEGDEFGSDDQYELDDAIFDRWWYRFDLNNHQRMLGVKPSDFNVGITAGRQQIHWGSGLALEEDLYALLAEVTAERATLTLLGAYTPPESTIDFDGSRPEYDRDTRRIFLGANLKLVVSSELRPYVFYLAQIDENTEDEATLNIDGVALDMAFEYDSQYVGGGAEGAWGENWAWSAEGIYQFGRSLSSPFDPDTGFIVPQSKDDISAWAAYGSLTYLFNDENDSNLYAWIIAASGDPDRLHSAQTFGGNEDGTQDKSFNSFGYLPTGFVLSPDPANLLTLRLGGSTRVGGSPVSNLRLGVDGYLYAKLDEDAAVSFLDTEGERFVGTALDVFARWQIFSDVSIDVRYGLFFAGDAIPEEEKDVRQLVLVGVTYAF